MQREFPFMSFEQIAAQMDKLGLIGDPFVFFVNYQATKGWIGNRSEAASLGVKMGIGEQKESRKPMNMRKATIEKNPISEEEYRIKFNQIQYYLKRGDTFLANLTAPTSIQIQDNFETIYQQAQASYKLLVPEKFVVFSPECFVRIENNEISSFPMKGTLSAAIYSSPEKLQHDKKENAEHATIVDLIRNDISRVAYPISVKKYKYIAKVKTNEGDLWQMSSSISGQLLPAFKHRYGQILKALLPAGSITGAPKESTLKIIDEIEDYDREFYTGIMGEFDGRNFDSGVMIRFIEKAENSIIFKSGGGITIYSDAEKEYQELIQKVYLPY